MFRTDEAYHRPLRGVVIPLAFRAFTPARRISWIIGNTLAAC